MKKEHQSWDAEWAEQKNIPEWPMWLLLLVIGGIIYLIEVITNQW